MKLTGLFFGSFNPIHVGHMIIANTMLATGGLDEVWLVVSPQNPFKQRATLLADHHRLEMVRRAVDDNYRLRACDVEMRLPRPSYTSLTLAHLSELDPPRSFCLIMGEDNLASFDRWRNADHILANCRLMVYPRPGSHNCPLASHPNVTMVQTPMMDISSSYIRAQIAAGHDVRYLLTEPVYTYLTEMHFYEPKKPLLNA